ncbi:glycosyltransferase family 4 protein [Endomicrobium sp. AH-315-J14]|nr:glycosyltransferase family 4 protein [Endomicrobium sp. AH-315-J14]
MRILAVNQFYAPDMSASSQLLTQLCEDLVRGGDEVTVIASRGQYRGGERMAARESINGVTVVRPWASSLGKEALWHRLSDYLSFWATSIGSVALEKRPDVILVLTTPPMIPVGAATVAFARRIPLCTWVQDVYPEVAVAFGLFSQGHPLIRLLGQLNRFQHRVTRLTVALSERMASRLREQGQLSSRIRVIPNWSDSEAIYPIAPEDNAFRREQGLEGRFVVMYSGNLGVGHDMLTLIDAARALEQSHPKIIFLFIGQGSRRGEAEDRARGLGNVRFLPYQPWAKLAESLSAADSHLISLRPGLAGLLVPSKLYGILAAGRPVFYLGPPDSEIARSIREHDVGWAGEARDVTGLVEAIAAASEDPSWAIERGERARQVFLDTYDRHLAVARWRKVLEEVVG